MRTAARETGGSPAGWSGYSLLAIRYSPLLVAFFLVRLPYLFAGYGADTDTYRVALAARYLWSEGEYLPSRLPGYPLHELLTAPLIWGGPFLTNVATALTALAGVLIFDRIVVALGVPHRWWLLVAMAFTPWLLVNSTITLDYHWALTAMLGAYLVLLRSGPRSAVQGPRSDGVSRTLDLRPWALDRGSWAAGCLVGVAAGFRLTAAAFLVPLVVLVVWRARAEDVRRDGAAAPWWGAILPPVSLVAGAAAVTMAAYLPVLWTYGPRFWNFADSRVSPDLVIQMVGQRALGVVGALTALAALAASWRQALSYVRLLRTDVHVLVWTLSVAIYALAFLRLPVDAGYLIPVYPFAFLLVARVLVRWALPAIVVATLVSGVVDLDIQGVHNFSPTAAAREVRPSWRVATLAHDYRTRTRWREYAARVVKEPAPPRSVVLTEGAFPVVAVVNWERLRYEIVERDLGAVSMISDNGALWDDARDVVYLAVSEPRVVERFRADGYAVYRAAREGPGWRVRIEPVEP